MAKSKFIIRRKIKKMMGAKKFSSEFVETNRKTLYQVFSKIDDALLYESTEKPLVDKFIQTTDLR